jgi:NADH-quinone oxidoreductase subunit E
MSGVGTHPNITLLTYSDVAEVSGHVGSFKIKLRRKARFVDEDKCTGCGQCIERCPVQHRAYQYPDYAGGNGEGHGLPLGMGLKEELRIMVDRIIGIHRHERAPLISILQDINKDLGYLPREVLRYISRETKVPLVRVYHVATFYKAFSLTPRGKHQLKVCMGTACHVRGAPRVLEALESRLKIKSGQTTQDLQFTLETVNCLGTCAMGPVVVADEEYVTLRSSDVNRLVDRLANEEQVQA